MTERDAMIVASLRRGYEAYSRGDFDEATRAFHPDIELVPAGHQPSIRGVQGVRAWMEPDAFERQSLELVGVTLAGDKVLVRVRARALGATSGIELHFDAWTVWTFDSDGLATRAEIYLDHQEAEAERAAGLRA
jgi:ketosteroid isomerase-like protein